MNIGYNPTFPHKNYSLEVNFLDFNQDLYNQTLTISFIKHIREELKFDSVEELKKQIKLDKDFSLAYLKLINE